jgi:chromosome partitioning protein
VTKTISFLNMKGGSGKTTAALGIAGELCKARKVLLIDSDISSESICAWNSIRERREIKHDNLVIRPEPYSFQDLRGIPQEATGFDHVIIDTPPEDSEILRTALSISDFIVLPVSPSPFDIRSAGKTIEVIREGRKEYRIKARPRLLINRAITGTIIAREARETLEVFKIPIFETEIASRVALCEAGIAGKTVQEYAAGSQAAEEFARLVKEFLTWAEGRG